MFVIFVCLLVVDSDWLRGCGLAFAELWVEKRVLEDLILGFAWYPNMKTCSARCR